MTTAALLSLAKLAAGREVLEMVCKGDSARDIGRRALLLLFLMDPEAIGNQRALARRLGVSPGRVCQMLNAIRRGLRK